MDKKKLNKKNNIQISKKNKNNEDFKEKIKKDYNEDYLKNNKEKKIPEYKLEKKLIDIIFSKKWLGLYIIFIGLSIFLKIIFGIKFVFFILIFFIFISIHLIVISISKEKRKKLIIPGISLILTSTYFLINFLLLEKFIPFKKIWPILGFFPSFSLISFYLISKRKNPATIIPGIFIGLLSIILLLIITKILKLEFKTFLLVVISGMLIFIGLYLIFNLSLFKNNKK